jgi:hypothetical protein
MFKPNVRCHYLIFFVLKLIKHCLILSNKINQFLQHQLIAIHLNQLLHLMYQLHYKPDEPMKKTTLNL